MLSQDFVSLMCNVAWYCVENRDSPDLEQTISVMLPAVCKENYPVKHPLVYAHLCNSAARMSAFQGDFESALLRLEEVLKIREAELSEHDAETGGTHNNIGNTHYSLRDFDAALEAHLRAGELWRRSPDFAYSGSGYEWMHNINLCRIHTARGEFEKAKGALVDIGFEEDNFDSPITERLVPEVSETRRLLLIQTSDWYYVGDFYRAQSLLDQALRAYTRCDEICASRSEADSLEGPSSRLMADCLYKMGHVALQQGNHDTARYVCLYP